jgi:hypothetical protein
VIKKVAERILRQKCDQERSCEVSKTNVIKKKAEKILKHKDLRIGKLRKWDVKTKVIQVIIGAKGTFSKSFKQYLSKIPGKPEIKELQNTAILGTVYIRVLW